MASPAPPTPLTDEEKAFFLSHGYVKLRGCFTAAQAAEMTAGAWTRLGMSAADRRTWTRARTNMPWHRTFDCAAFAPRAWAAICELCGGEERVGPPSRRWRDSLIVSLGSAEREGRPVPPKDLDEWHVDGDFFVHYLDSPEQALLVIPLFTDIVPEGGGTMLCPDAIPKIARWLYDHPDGVSPRMQPRSDPNFTRELNLKWYQDVARSCDDSSFVEATGEVGDVYLMHPLMMHCATSNALRRVRIITNPPVSLREPHCFDRPDGRYSLVEQKTLRALGRDALEGWHITAPREEVVPERVRVQEAMKREEARRLAMEMEMEGGQGKVKNVSVVAV